jgi:hypothetical protein
MSVLLFGVEQDGNGYFSPPTVDYARQLRISSAIVRIAREVYQAKCEFIGGGCLDWNELTVRQRAAAMGEVERLVKGEQ